LAIFAIDLISLKQMFGLPGCGSSMRGSTLLDPWAGLVGWAEQEMGEGAGPGKALV
jgi:hypothetical protein